MRFEIFSNFKKKVQNSFNFDWIILRFLVWQLFRISLMELSHSKKFRWWNWPPFNKLFCEKKSKNNQFFYPTGGKAANRTKKLVFQTFKLFQICNWMNVFKSEVELPCQKIKMVNTFPITSVESLLLLLHRNKFNWGRVTNILQKNNLQNIIDKKKTIVKKIK